MLAQPAKKTFTAVTKSACAITTKQQAAVQCQDMCWISLGNNTSLVASKEKLVQSRINRCTIGVDVIDET